MAEPLHQRKRLAETYRRYAADCLRLSQTVKQGKDRQELIQMATVWQGLAERLEREPPGTMFSGDSIPGLSIRLRGGEAVPEMISLHEKAPAFRRGFLQATA